MTSSRRIVASLLLALASACGSSGPAAPDAGPEIDGGRRQQWTVVEPGDVRDLDLDLAADRVWAATATGVLRVEGGVVTRFASADGLPSVRCTAIAVDPDRQRVWVGTEDAGLAVYEDGSWRRGPALPIQNVGALAVEASGALWVGSGAASEVQGAYRVVGAAVETFATDGSDVRSILRTASGDVWFGTGLRGAAVRPAADGAWTWHNSTTLGFGLGAVDGLYQDAGGAIWVATLGDGLARFGDGRWTVWNRGFAPDMPNAYLSGVVVDRAGEVWASSKGSGLIRLSGWTVSAATVAGTGAWTMYRTSNSGFPDQDNDTNDVVIDRHDALWIAMPSGGLARFD